MTRVYRFGVQGLPPKKSGARSMWASDLEAPRILALRSAAREEIGGRGPLVSDITLNLRMYLDRNDRSVGDLDTFVAGVCDALQPAAGDPAGVAAVLADENCQEAVGLEDDVSIVRIEAEKLVTGVEGIRYEVELRGE